MLIDSNLQLLNDETTIAKSHQNRNEFATSDNILDFQLTCAQQRQAQLLQMGCSQALLLPLGRDSLLGKLNRIRASLLQQRQARRYAQRAMAYRQIFKDMRLSHSSDSINSSLANTATAASTDNNGNLAQQATSSPFVTANTARRQSLVSASAIQRAAKSSSVSSTTSSAANQSNKRRMIVIQPDPNAQTNSSSSKREV
jgi:hypothetical protein